MAITLSILSRNTAGKAITDLIDKGTSSPTGYIEIRDGSRPATPDATSAGTNILAVLSFSVPSFGSFNNGAANANAIADDTRVNKTGVAKWFRIYDRDGTAIIDGDVKLTGAGGDIEFDNINFIAGGVVSIPSFRIDLFSNKCP